MLCMYADPTIGGSLLKKIGKGLAGRSVQRAVSLGKEALFGVIIELHSRVVEWHIALQSSPNHDAASSRQRE